MPRERRTCLVYHVNEGLRVVPKEATDCITFILTGEDHFDHGREFMRSKRPPDQTSASWSIER